MSTPAILALLAVLSLTLALPWWLYRILRPAAGPFMVCTTCGHCGRGRRRVKGSMLIEVVLWLALIVPGLIYSLWRLSTRSSVCESCGAGALVQPDSPVGRRMLAGMGLATPPAPGQKWAPRAQARSSFPPTWTR